MREIGSLPNEQQAKTFFDYLTARGVASTVEQEEDIWTVWIHEEDQVEEAQKELAEYQESPGESKYLEAAKFASSLRKEAAKKREQIRKREIDARKSLNPALQQVIPVTLCLMFASVTLSVASRFGDTVEPIRTQLSIAKIEDAGDGKVRFFNTRLSEVRRGEVWRLFTPMFLHFGPIHLLFNMYWLFFFGRMLEPRGRLKFLFMVLIISALSNLGQYLESGPSFGGMSGVGYGLFGYVWLRSRLDPWSNLFLNQQTVFWFIVFFLACITGALGPVANTAHGVGLAVGMAWGYLDASRRMQTG